MEYVLLVVAGIVALFVAGAFALRMTKTSGEARARVLTAALFYIATLAPAVVTVISPRIGTGDGFAEFSGTQSPVVGLIVRGVGWLFLAAAPLLLLLRLGSRHIIPGAAFALAAYAVVGWASSWINQQPVSTDLFYAAGAVAAILLSSTVTLPQALRMSQVSLRFYVWASLALAVVMPGIAFWSGQGRTWFGLSQLAGVTAHPNGMGTVAALAIVVELVRVEGAKRPRVWHLLAAVAALLLTQSRGAWLGAAIGIIIYLTFRSGARIVVLIAPLLLVGLLTASTLISDVADSLVHWSAGGNISTLNGRTTIWDAGIRAFEANPMFGTGPRSFDPEYRGEVLGLGHLISSSNAHNQIVQTLVERGAIGLIILAVLVVILFRNAIRVGRPAQAGLVAVLAVFVSRFAVETPLNISTASLNGAVLVIVAVLLASTSNEPRVQRAVKEPAAREPKLPDAYRHFPGQRPAARPTLRRPHRDRVPGGRRVVLGDPD